MKKITFKIIDTLNQHHVFEIEPNRHRSLLDFIVTELYEDIGDCMGRAWCGTCMVKQLSNFPLPIELETERLLVSKIPESQHLRLSCQLTLNTDLNQTIWKIIDARYLL